MPPIRTQMKCLILPASLLYTYSQPVSVPVGTIYVHAGLADSRRARMNFLDARVTPAPRRLFLVSITSHEALCYGQHRSDNGVTNSSSLTHWSSALPWGMPISSKVAGP